MFFAELHSWAIAVTAVALFLLVETAFVGWFLLRQAQTRWLTALLLPPLGISIWALLVAQDTFKTLDSLDSAVPRHGKSYFRMIVESASPYTNALFHCQFVTLLAALAALLVVGILLLPRLTRRRAHSPELP